MDFFFSSPNHSRTSQNRVLTAISAILGSSLRIRYVVLSSDIHQACSTCQLRVVCAIFPTKPSDLSTIDVLDNEWQLCFRVIPQHDHSVVILNLFPKTPDQSKRSHFRKAFTFDPLLYVTFTDVLQWARHLHSHSRAQMRLIAFGGYFSTVGGAYATSKQWRQSLKYALWLKRVGTALMDERIIFQCDLYIGLAMLWKGNVRKAKSIFNELRLRCHTEAEKRQCDSALSKI